MTAPTGNRRAGTAPRRAAGLTLLELILVVIVLFVLAGVAVPRFSDFFPALQVRRTAERILAWAGKARADAALTGARHRLVLDAETRRFWIEYEPRPLREPFVFRPLGGAWEAEPIPGEVLLESFQGFEEEGGLRILTFRPDGTAADASLAVTNERGDRRTVRVEGATGRITIERPAEEDVE